jgi:hypothetical protein
LLDGLQGLDRGSSPVYKPAATRQPQTDRSVMPAMVLTSSSPPVSARRAHASRPSRRTGTGARHDRRLSCRPQRFGAYLDGNGRRRELVALAGHADSLLVVDRDAQTLCDRRLIAHLGAEEPPGNAAIVCGSYLSRPGRRRCRRLLAADLLASPPGESRRAELERCLQQSIEVDGHTHRLRRVHNGRGAVELRWCRRPCAHPAESWEPLRARELVAALECYEPVRTSTAAAIDRHRDDPAVSVRQLRSEYRWLCTSPVVLNRALREAVLRALAGGELSMSEIALRCGAIKRDRSGKRSGETSWLARRVGLMPEGGAKQTTPWIHSDVLAVIARKGLRVCPREVEVL